MLWPTAAQPEVKDISMFRCVAWFITLDILEQSTQSLSLQNHLSTKFCIFNLFPLSLQAPSYISNKLWFYSDIEDWWNLQLWASQVKNRVTITDDNHEHGCMLWPRLVGRLVGGWVWQIIVRDRFLDQWRSMRRKNRVALSKYFKMEMSKSRHASCWSTQKRKSTIY